VILQHLYQVRFKDDKKKCAEKTYQLVNGISVPILNFENSDDRGKSLIPGVKKSHLFHCKMKFNLKAFQAVVDEYFPGNDPVVEIQLPI